MGWIDSIALTFINTFGITVPTEAQRRRASWVIVAMLVLCVGLVGLVGYMFARALHG